MNWDRLRSCDDTVQSELAESDFHGALEALVHGYQHAVVGFCRNMLGDVTQAEEVAQEVFLAAHKAMPRFRRQSSVRTWLFAIARKQCLKTLRNRGRRSRIVHDKRSFIAEGVHRDPPLEPGEEPEALLRLVQQGLNQLPDAERALLTMRYDTGLAVAEIAHILRISTASVRRRLAHALRCLREVMDSDA